MPVANVGLGGPGESFREVYSGFIGYPVRCFGTLNGRRPS
jgi:hypothetical protein